MELLIYWGDIILTRGSVPALRELGKAIEELGRLLVVSLICCCRTNFTFRPKPKEKNSHSQD